MPHSAIVGAILGTAIGDALGLPYENLSPRRGRRLFGEPDRYRLLPGRGLVSDDTEHTCLVAQALIASGGDVEVFTRDLGRRLRWWLLSISVGLGRATLKAGLRLWLGFPPTRSGVWSAGNGPAMRSAVVGAAIDDLAQMRALVAASTRVTHTDPRAEYGAVAVALAARLARESAPVSGDEYLERLRVLLPEPATNELHERLTRAARSANAGEATTAFAVGEGLGRGVSGYVYHTVPVAIHAWLRHPRDIATAVTETIRCGGDADTTAAVVGGIVGSGVGKAGIPKTWLRGLRDWPRTVAWMERLGEAVERVLAAGRPETPPRLPALPLVARNLFFFGVVLAHVFRRCLPPY